MSNAFSLSNVPEQQDNQRKDIQYLTFDSIHEGVGASQVLAYLNQLAMKFNIKLINFEKEKSHFQQPMKFDWNPILFGDQGILSGIGRIFRLMRYIDPNLVTHARGDFACFAALLKGSQKVIWDCRALTADQRYEIARKSKVSLIYLALRFIELVCAKRSRHIIVITEQAQQELSKRYKIANSKFSVISTCVDLKMFRSFSEHTSVNEVKILLSGTIGPQYDLILLGKLISQLKKERKIKVGVAASIGKFQQDYPFPIDDFFEVSHASMPEIINNYDVGFASWHSNLGVSLKSVAATKNAEFLACGRPIIVNFNQGDIGNAVTNQKIGVATKTDSEDEILEYSKKLLALIDDPKTSERCREYAELHYSLDDATKRIAAIYKALA